MLNANKFEENDLPFSGPSEWYPYYCCACKLKIWVEDIVIDAFPPDGPGKCPILCCPECGKNLIRDMKADSFMSEADPNRTGILF